MAFRKIACNEIQENRMALRYLALVADEAMSP